MSYARIEVVLLALAAMACAPEESARNPAATPQAAQQAASSAPALEPALYLKLHNTAREPQAAGWAEALAELATSGDGYSLLSLRSLDRATLTETQLATLDATLAALQARGADADGPLPPSAIETRLERAAWADLLCDRCEGTLVPWATQSIAAHAAEPAVRAELERLRDGYEPRFEVPSQWSTLSQRVRNYAHKLLEGQGAQAATKTP